jgi:hypothetical protein
MRFHEIRTGFNSRLLGNVAQVALEAGNTPQMIFKHFRELVRPADAEKWFAVTPTAVEAVKEARQKAEEQPSNVIALQEKAAA